MNVFSDYHHRDALDSLYRLFEGRLGMKLYVPAGKQYVLKGHVSIVNNLEKDKVICRGLYCHPSFPKSDGKEILSHSSLFRYPIRHLPWRCFNDVKFDIFLATLPHNIYRFKKLAQLNNPKAKIVFRAGNNWPCLPRDPFMVNNLLLPSALTYIQGMTPVFEKFPYNKRKLLYGGNHWMEKTQFGDFNVCYAHSEFGKFFRPSMGGMNVKSILSLMHCIPPEQQDYLYSLASLLPNWKLDIFGQLSEGGLIKHIEDEADLIRNHGFFAHLKTHGDGYGFNLHRAAYCGCQLLTRLSYYKGVHHPNDYMSACLLFGEDNFIDVDKGKEYVLGEMIHRSRHYEEYFSAAIKRVHRVMNFDQEELHIRKFIENLI